MATTRKRGRPISLTDSARKERKRQADKDRNKGKIFIGDNIERWNRLKSELNLNYHHEVAGVLLDRFVYMICLFHLCVFFLRTNRFPYREIFWDRKNIKYQIHRIPLKHCNINICKRFKTIFSFDEMMGPPKGPCSFINKSCTCISCMVSLSYDITYNI